MTEYQVRRAAAEDALQREIDRGAETHPMTFEEYIGGLALMMLLFGAAVVNAIA